MDKWRAEIRAGNQRTFLRRMKIQVWKNILHFWHLPDLTHLLREVIVESFTLIVILIQLLLHFLHLFLFRADLHFLSLIQTVVGLTVHVSLYDYFSAFLRFNRVHFCSCPHKFLISSVNLFGLLRVTFCAGVTGLVAFCATAGVTGFGVGLKSGVT